uniref:COMM domain-containing protein 3 n=1 Tax=Branchiostoma belcheri TaxID=7741 RepID=A0A2Z4HQL4_BRABE|nr:COMMD3 [Branchiostoma belcheri]
MELSTEVQEGLQLCGDSAQISDPAFNFLVKSACDTLLQGRKRGKDVLDDPSVAQSDPAVLKQVFASLTTLLLEAAKHNTDSTNTSSLLEDCKMSPDRIEAFNNVYMSNRTELQSVLSSTGSGFPHIVDVDWRLDYYIKNNHLDHVNEPTYLVTLKTEEPGSSELKDVQFACTVEQLQDMVGKLKDACKSMEKASQT